MTTDVIQEYTVGFTFDSRLEQVLLVHKIRPAWQHGQLNGIGGKFEANEDMFQCIVRETQEESTLQTTRDDWKYVGELMCNNSRIYILTAIYSGELSDAKQGDYEEIEWFEISNLPKNLIDEAYWLIPMSKQTLSGHTSDFKTKEA